MKTRPTRITYNTESVQTKYNNYEQSMITMNNLLDNLLHCQQLSQNDMMYTLQSIQKSQRDYANHSLTDYIPILMVSQRYILTGY